MIKKFLKWLFTQKPRCYNCGTFATAQTMSESTLGKRFHCPKCNHTTYFDLI